MNNQDAHEAIVKELGLAGFHSRHGVHSTIFYRPLPRGKKVAVWVLGLGEDLHLQVRVLQGERVIKHQYIRLDTIQASIFDLTESIFLGAVRDHLEEVLLNGNPRVMDTDEFRAMNLRFMPPRPKVGVYLRLAWYSDDDAEPIVLNPQAGEVYFEDLWAWLLGFQNEAAEEWFTGVVSDLVDKARKRNQVSEWKSGVGASREVIQEAEKWLGFDVTEPRECNLERRDAGDLDEECLGVVTFRERENVSGDRTYHVHRINTFVSWVRDKDGWADTGHTIGVIGQPEFRSTESARLTLVKTLPPNVLGVVRRSMEAVLAEYQIRAASLLHQSSTEYVLGLMRLMRDVTLDRPLPGEDGPDEAPRYRILRRDGDEGVLAPTGVTIDYTVLVPWLVTYAGGSKDGIPRDTREGWLKFRESLGEVCENAFRDWRDNK